MKYSIVSGSCRKDSQSEKVARYIARELHEGGDECFVLTLGEVPDDWEDVRIELEKSEAFVFVVPDWGGMIPAEVKNFFLLCTPVELGHKPALNVSIRSSAHGSNTSDESHPSSFKNNRVIHLPEPLIIRQVKQVMNVGKAWSREDIHVRKRLSYCLELLRLYAECLQGVRSSRVADSQGLQGTASFNM